MCFRLFAEILIPTVKILGGGVRGYSSGSESGALISSLIKGTQKILQFSPHFTLRGRLSAIQKRPSPQPMYVGTQNTYVQSVLQLPEQTC